MEIGFPASYRVLRVPYTFGGVFRRAVSKYELLGEPGYLWPMLAMLVVCVILALFNWYKENKPEENATEEPAVVEEPKAE